MLVSQTVLHHLDPVLNVVVTTDASNHVLQQESQYKLRTSAFASRSLTTAERKCSVDGREGLASLGATNNWHSHLWGRRFQLCTERQGQVAFPSSQSQGRDPLSIARWTARLQC